METKQVLLISGAIFNNFSYIHLVVIFQRLTLQTPVFSSHLWVHFILMRGRCFPFEDGVFQGIRPLGQGMMQLRRNVDRSVLLLYCFLWKCHSGMTPVVNF